MYNNTIKHPNLHQSSEAKTGNKKPVVFVWKIIIGSIGVLLVVSLVRNIRLFIAANNRIAQTMDVATKLEAENNKLKNEAEEVTSDFFKEKQARDKLGYSKEGEVAVVLPPQEMLRRLAPQHPEEEKATSSIANWKKWLKLFDF